MVYNKWLKQRKFKIIVNSKLILFFTFCIKRKEKRNYQASQIEDKHSKWCLSFSVCQANIPSFDRIMVI